MKRSGFTLLALLVASLIVGCADPTPSTTLAPEKPLPDVSKMSNEDVNRMLANDKANDRKPEAAPAGR